MIEKMPEEIHDAQKLSRESIYILILILIFFSLALESNAAQPGGLRDFCMY